MMKTAGKPTPAGGSFPPRHPPREPGLRRRAHRRVAGVPFGRPGRGRKHARILEGQRLPLGKDPSVHHRGGERRESGGGVAGQGGRGRADRRRRSPRRMELPAHPIRDGGVASGLPGGAAGPSEPRAHSAARVPRRRRKQAGTALRRRDDFPRGRRRVPGGPPTERNPLPDRRSGRQTPCSGRRGGSLPAAIPHPGSRERRR